MYLEIEIKNTNHRTIYRKKIIQHSISSVCLFISKLTSILDVTSEKAPTCYIRHFCSIVSEACAILKKQLGPCLVRTSNIAGVNRESSQSAFFKMTCGEDLEELSTVTGDHQLTMWLALQVFTKALDESNNQDNNPRPLVRRITVEETDIAHYIGGAVVSKLKNRSKNDDEINVLGKLVTDHAPEEGTLLQAKSRGKLTNMTSDAKGMFVELEQVFRDTFPYTTAKVNAADYKAACYKNKVIQDCYFSAVFAFDNVTLKDKVLSDIIQLYFTIRIHHKCKIILDSVRAKSKVSSKDRALCAKLAK